MAYVDGASSGKATAALYAVSGSSAGALLEQSSAVSIGTTFSWIDFSLSTPYTVTAGTTYGLAVMGNVPVNIVIVTGTGQRTGGPGYSSYTNGFANPFGTIWFNDYTGAMSIYATGTSTSTPTPTTTPTPVPTSTPISDPTPAPAQTPSSTNGQLIIYFDGALYDGNGNPNAAANRIAQGAQTYGNPQWLVIGNGANNNGGVANIPIPATFITYMHNHGVKVMSHCHTEYGTYTLAQVEAQIDYQMSHGSNVDGFEMDEVSNSLVSYYIDLGNYVKSKGSNLFYSMNTGQRDISDGIAGIDNTIGLNGWVNFEAAYYYFATHGGTYGPGTTDMYPHATPLIAEYPQRFAGITSNWYIWYFTQSNPAASYIVSPNAQTIPITESQAVTLVHEAWNHGIYYFGVLWDSNPNGAPPSGDCAGFPTWWEDFLSQLKS